MIGELLRTQRLILRRLTFDDGPSIVELDSDPEVMKYVASPATLQIWKESLWPRTVA